MGEAELSARSNHYKPRSPHTSQYYCKKNAKSTLNELPRNTIQYKDRTRTTVRVF